MGGVSSSQSMVLSTLERMLLIQRAEGFHGNDVMVCLFQLKHLLLLHTKASALLGSLKP